MTQDQYGQHRDPGYVRGDVVTDDDTEAFPAEESKPMTRFQKVASALRGGGADGDTDRAEGEDEAVAVTRPEYPASVPAARSGEPAPDTADHAATEPDMHAAAASASGAAPAAASAESRPGEAAGMLGDFSDLTYGNLIPDTAVYIEQWQQVQFKFVDDPHASVTEAADIVAQVTAKMEAAIQERQRAIEERQHAIAGQQRSLRGRWGEGTNADTEALRETLRMYKTFLDQLIGPRAS
jgi:hypothetical protein